MNCKGLVRIITLVLILLSIFTACQFNSDPEIEYEIIISSDTILSGQSYQVNLRNKESEQLITDYAPFGEYTYEITSGNTYASINAATGLLSIAALAPEGHSVTVTFTNGTLTYNLTITIEIIAVNSVAIVAYSDVGYVGKTVEISGNVTPGNATISDITYSILSGAEYATINSATGLVTINIDATIGATVTIQGNSQSILSNVITLTISSIEVTSVTIDEINSNTNVPQGGQLSFSSIVLPIDASYPTVNYSIVSGSQYGAINEESGVLEIFSNAPAGSQISVKGTSDGIDSNVYVVTVDMLQLAPVELSAERYNVEINGSVDLTPAIKPYAVHGVHHVYQINEGLNYCNIIDNTLYVLAHAPSGGVIKVIAWVEDDDGEIQGTRSNEITINVYKIQVVSVLLHTSDNTLLVPADGIVTFGVTVNPINSTETVPQYIITSGANHAEIDRNSGVLTVLKNNEDGNVSVMALVDGVYSNAVTISTAKYYYTIGNTTWNVFDPLGSVFLGYRNIKLDIKDMPEDASLTTIVIPSTVKRLTIEGAYSYISPVTTKNLMFYFNKATTIDIQLINVGIVIEMYSGGNIFDLPQNSTAAFTLQGDSYLEAGTFINPFFYSVDGVYDPNDEKFEFRKHGMDGHNGAYGGTAISGFNLEFKGSGNMFIKGGNGASGSNGGNGADVPAGSPSLSVSGNGGCGGSGGNAGYAIYGYNITVNMSMTGLINSFSGNAGCGGTGGSRGQTIVDGVYGLNGANGINGSNVSAIAAYNNLLINSGYVYQTNGTLSSVGWTVPPSETINQMILRMEKTFGLDMHVKEDLFNPYNDPLKTDYYPMTNLYDDNAVLFMLRIIDNVLSKYPSNIFREIRITSGKEINIYVVNTIKSGSIAGLASTANNVWLAYTTPNIRNIFYSDVENFAFHELTHIIMYNASSYFTKAGVEAFNGSYGYISGTSTAGIYNPSLGYNKNNSHFLTSYSRRNYSEDVCETFSMIARQSRYWDFLDSGTPIRGKMGYIVTAMDNGYETCSFHKREYWERFL